MLRELIGEPHAIRRYVAFGLVAGVLAGIGAVAFSVPLLWTVVTAAAVVGATGGLGGQAPPVPPAPPLPTA